MGPHRKLCNLFICNFDMNKFCLRILLFLSPLLLVLILYLVHDPFKVVKHYDCYYPTDGSPLILDNNRSFVSTKMFLQNNKQYKYDSFIFGSSRSGFYLVNDWKKHLDSNVSCFHFDGYEESLYMIYQKIKFVDGKSKMKNVIVCMDPDLIDIDTPYKDYTKIPSAALIGYHQWGAFHAAHLYAYFNPRFFITYYFWKITGKETEKMSQWQILSLDSCAIYQPIINERNAPIPADFLPDDFYDAGKMEAFAKCHEAGGQLFPLKLMPNHKKMLIEIRDILENNGSDYRVILNPIFSQNTLCEDDHAFLIKTFGPHLFDFSGKNVFTDDYHNYMETVHFTPRVAEKIMNVVYDSDSIHQQFLMDSIFYR